MLVWVKPWIGTHLKQDCCSWSFWLKSLRSSAPTKTRTLKHFFAVLWFGFLIASWVYLLYMFCSIVFEKTCQEQLQLSRLFKLSPKTRPSFFHHLKWSKKNIAIKDKSIQCAALPGLLELHPVVFWSECLSRGALCHRCGPGKGRTSKVPNVCDASVCTRRFQGGHAAIFASFCGIDTVDRRNPIVSRLYHVDIDFFCVFFSGWWGWTSKLFDFSTTHPIHRWRQREEDGLKING